MQRKLRQWATDDPTKKFVDLYSLLCNVEWLRVAYRSVNLHWSPLDGVKRANIPMGDRGRHNKLLRHDSAQEANQGGEETRSRQEHQRPSLDIPACRCCGTRDTARNPDWH